MEIKKIITIFLVCLLVIGSSVPAYATITTGPQVAESGDILIQASETTLEPGVTYPSIGVSLTNPRSWDSEVYYVSAKYGIDNPTTVFLEGSTSENLNGRDYFSINFRTLPTDKDVTVPINISVEYDVFETTSSGQYKLLDEKTFDKDGLIYNSDGTKFVDENNNQYDVYSVYEIEIINGKITNDPRSFIKKQTLTASDTIYVIQKATPSSSMIEIEKMALFPVGDIYPGMDFQVAFEVYNPGDAPAKNIKLELEGLEEAKLNMADGLSTKDITVLNPGAKSTVIYALSTPASTPGGKYQLNLKYTFNDAQSFGGTTSAPKEGNYNFSIDIKRSDSAPSVMIFDTIDFPEGRIWKNKDVKVSFGLKNIGKENAQNVKITATSTNPSGLAPKSGSTVHVPVLKPGKVANYSFDFETTGSVNTEGYPVEIKVTYVDDSVSLENPHELTQTIIIDGVDWYAESQKYKDGNKSIPKLIVEQYKFEPDKIYAGTEFNMTLVLYNTSKKTIKNIKIFLASESVSTGGEGQQMMATEASVFNPVQSSNTFFIDNIPPGEKIEKTITLSTSHDTPANTYTLTANMEYEDSAAEQYQSSEIIGIPVIQDAGIGIGEIVTDYEYSVGMPGSLSVEFYNTGRVQLSNFMVELEGNDISTDTATYYRGNMAPGVSDSFMASITPETVDANEGTIVFKFEDSTGEEHEIRKDFKINVVEMPVFDEEMPMEDEGMMDDSGGGLPKLPLILGIIAIAVVGFIFYKRHKKNKDEKDLTIDED